MDFRIMLRRSILLIENLKNWIPRAPEERHKWNLGPSPSKPNQFLYFFVNTK